MKTIRNLNICGTHILLLIFAMAFMFQSCEEYPHEYEVAGGVPKIDYIRITTPEKSDSLIISASLNSTITIIGENLRSITEMWFNDKKAYLNTSFITSNALIVNIPNEIPGVVSDKIYMVAGKDTLTYDFNVVVPPPAPKSMLCEFVEDGDEAVIYGNYFIDDMNVPLQVIFPGEVEGEVISVSDDFDEIIVKVPVGAAVGQITVKSIYGSTRSSFFFRDDRNYILDWDNLDAAGGWRSGVIASTEPTGISGNYVRFHGDMTGAVGETWNEDAHSFNLWNASNGRSDEPFYEGDLSAAVLKFECYVVEEWKASALQMIFTPYSVSATNSYIADGMTPRGLWIPWASSGSYRTEGWTTVTIPMSEFHYYHDGTDAGSAITNDMLGGLTFFVWNGGVEGEDCSVHMCIDNIRIVPM
ncbi:glycan-binding surface protein [Saccharicrinis fermentans]|uniref:IPT/TIG domain protein n=1 Tax=Saccharicrinis fermentans DSM 9555 = JCM 21142 TaxID=869213 RepID=W7YN08_9BACT|nr:glycan-binding surface protein [Saccharicrinis fermentans]GAF03779.1 IPT/TIG domain protein [Saccharicrinis fermentans DSM 9555 = JCM 21142]